MAERPGNAVRVILDPDLRFTDRGTLDTHGASLDLGDGSGPASLPVSEAPHGPPGSVTPAAGRAMQRIQRVVTSPGAHQLTLSVADDDAGDAQVAGPVLDIPSVDLQLDTAFDPPAPAAGSPIRHALTVINSSLLATARRATVSDQLPASTSILSANVVLSTPGALGDLVGARLGRAEGEAGDTAGCRRSCGGSAISSRRA